MVELGLVVPLVDEAEIPKYRDDCRVWLQRMECDTEIAGVLSSVSRNGGKATLARYCLGFTDSRRAARPTRQIDPRTACGSAQG